MDERKPPPAPQKLAWLSLDEGDHDPARFLTCLIAALQTIEPDPGKVALALIQSLAPPAGESILTALLNEMAALPQDPSNRAGQRFMSHPFAVLDEWSEPIYSSLAHPYIWPLLRQSLENLNGDNVGQKW